MMAFEDLQTDEKLLGPIEKEADMDTQMIGGCSVFVSASLLTYGIAIWPFFALHPRIYELGTLTTACVSGLLPAAAFGAFASIKWGLPAGCGFFGGALTTAVFLYLSLQQAALGHTVRELPVPEYPAAFMWWIPSMWLVVALVVGLLFATIGERRRGLLR